MAWLARALAALLVLGATGCGRSSAGNGAGGGTAGATPDPVAAKIATNVGAPFYVAMSRGEGAQDGIYATMLDDNGELSQGVGGWAMLVPPTYTADIAKTKCFPEKLNLASVPDAGWMMARVLQHVEGAAFEKQGQSYMPVPKLFSTYRFSATNGDRWCGTWFYYYWGNFKAKTVTHLNEFQGPDPKTGALTTMRSYKIVAEFVPTKELSSVLPSGTTFGTFTWIIVVERDPVSTVWFVSRQDGNVGWKL